MVILKKLPTIAALPGSMVCLLLVLSLALPDVRVWAAADPYTLTPGRSRYDVQSLLIQAEQGDKRAAFLLGSRYAAGDETTRDDSEALRWFTQAAQEGLAEAQYNLGVMYAQGRGVPRNLATAVGWYTRAAKQGLGIAQFNLGTLYSTGTGVPKNETVAADWMERAAKKGIAQAQYNLAVFYEYGHGVRLNAAKALHWYQQAEVFGYAPARARRAHLQRLLQVPDTAQAATLPPSVPLSQPQSASNQDTVAQSSQPQTEVKPAVADIGSGAEKQVPEAVNHTNPIAAIDWLKNLNPEHYTLQLSSYVDENAAQHFIRELGVAQRIGVYASVKQGKHWYSVIYGDFASYEQAQAATRKLPASFKGLKPWVRKVSVIKALME